MKKAMLGLSALIAVSCQKPLDERAIEIVVNECNNTLVNTDSAVILYVLDLPADNEYLSPEQIARVDYVLQEKTDCHLSVYLDKVNGKRAYLVGKEHSAFETRSFQLPRYEKIYPIHK